MKIATVIFFSVFFSMVAALCAAEEVTLRVRNPIYFDNGCSVTLLKTKGERALIQFSQNGRHHKKMLKQGESYVRFGISLIVLSIWTNSADIAFVNASY